MRALENENGTRVTNGVQQTMVPSRGQGGHKNLVDVHVKMSNLAMVAVVRTREEVTLYLFQTCILSRFLIL